MEYIIKYLILPSNLIIFLFGSGGLLFFIRKFKRLGTYLMLSAMALFVIFGAGPVSFWLLGNLEYQYDPLYTSEAKNEFDIILILTGHAEVDSKISLSSRVNSTSAFRLLESLRILHLNPNANIIITGYREVPDIMKKLLISIGVLDSKIIVEKQSNNTFESAENVHFMIKDKSFVLVTSAGHMPRAMMVFKKLGLRPTPAPTNYLTRRNNMSISYLPSPLHLRHSDLAIHEYAGIFWYRLIGKI